MEIKTLLVIIAIFLLFNGLTLLYSAIIHKQNHRRMNKRWNQEEPLRKLNEENHRLNKELLQLYIAKEKNN